MRPADTNSYSPDKNVTLQSDLIKKEIRTNQRVGIDDLPDESEGVPDWIPKVHDEVGGVPDWNGKVPDKDSILNKSEPFYKVDQEGEISPINLSKF